MLALRDGQQNSQTMPSHQTKKPLYENARIMLCNRCDPTPNAVAEATKSRILCTLDLVTCLPKLMDMLTAARPDPAPFYMPCGASLRTQKYKWFA